MTDLIAFFNFFENRDPFLSVFSCQKQLILEIFCNFCKMGPSFKDFLMKMGPMSKDLLWRTSPFERHIPVYSNPNSIIHHQTSQKLSPKHAARGVAQSPYPICRHGKACLSKQPPWRAAGDPRLARGRSRVRAPGPAGALRTLFFSTLSSFLLREIVFFAPSPPNPRKC